MKNLRASSRELNKNVAESGNLVFKLRYNQNGLEYILKKIKQIPFYQIGNSLQIVVQKSDLKRLLRSEAIVLRGRNRSYLTTKRFNQLYDEEELKAIKPISLKKNKTFISFKQKESHISEFPINNNVSTSNVITTGNIPENDMANSLNTQKLNFKDLKVYLMDEKKEKAENKFFKNIKKEKLNKIKNQSQKKLIEKIRKSLIEDETTFWLYDDDFMYFEFSSLNIHDKTSIISIERTRELWKNHVNLSKQKYIGEDSNNEKNSDLKNKKIHDSFEAEIKSLKYENFSDNRKLKLRGEQFAKKFNSLLHCLSDQQIEELYLILFPEFINLINNLGWEKVIAQVVAKNTEAFEEFKGMIHSYTSIFFRPKCANAQVYLVEILKASDDKSAKKMAGPIFDFIKLKHIKNKDLPKFTRFCCFLIEKFDKKTLLKLSSLKEYIENNPHLLFEKMMMKRAYLLLFEKIASKMDIRDLYEKVENRIIDLMKSKDANLLVSIFLEANLEDFRINAVNIALKNFKEVLTMKYSKFFMIKLLEQEKTQELINRVFNELWKLTK